MVEIGCFGMCARAVATAISTWPNLASLVAGRPRRLDINQIEWVAKAIKNSNSSLKEAKH